MTSTFLFTTLDNLEFHIPRLFHPGHAPLGRWLRRRTGDRLRAEAFHLVALTGGVLLLLLVHYLLWVLVPTLSPLLRWGVEAGLLALLVLLGAWGHQPGTAISCAPEVLHVEQGQRRLTLPYDEIEAVETISPLVFHRHYRRYAATRAFTGRLRDDLLLLKTAQGPVVLGLASDDHTAFRACLEKRHPVEEIHAAPGT